MNSRRVLNLMFVAVALAGCSSAPQISDTGYVGTWGRGNERSRSTIAIVKVGEGYRFRWIAASENEKWKVICDWEGNCKELLKDEQVATYLIEPSLDPASGRLHVKTTRTGSKTSPPIHNVDLDELVVESGGKVLRSYIIQRNEDHYPPGEGSTRFFDKVSDEVDDPPPASKN